MTKSNIFNKIGLNDKELKIYTSLIERGPLLIAQIAKQTGLHRPAIYKNLPNLISKGLVTVSFKGKTGMPSQYSFSMLSAVEMTK